MKAPRATFNESRVVTELTLLGRMFHSHAALTPKETSNAVDIDFCALWLNVGIVALTPSLGEVYAHFFISNSL